MVDESADVASGVERLLEKGFETLADESTSPEERIAFLRYLREEVTQGRTLTMRQVALLNQLLTSQDSSFNLTLMETLGEVGNAKSLDAMIDLSVKFRHGKSRVVVTRAIASLSDRLNVAVRPRLHPLFRK